MNAPQYSAAAWLHRVLISALVWVLFTAACAVPAVYLDDGHPACTAIRMGSPPGWVALLLGWMPPYCVPWSANLLLAAGWTFLLFGRFKTAAWLGAAGALVALTTWGFDFPHLLVGYYLWQASLVVLTTGAAVLARVAPTSPARVSEAEGASNSRVSKS